MGRSAVGIPNRLLTSSETEMASRERSRVSRTHAHYENADLATQAAVLAHGIAEGQHFIDGNKRTALVAMRTFLLINGFELTASQSERAGWMLGLSSGLSVAGLAEELRRRMVLANVRKD